MSSVIYVKTTVTTEIQTEHGLTVTRTESFQIQPPVAWDRTTVEENVIASANTFRSWLRRNLSDTVRNNHPLTPAAAGSMASAGESPD